MSLWLFDDATTVHPVSEGVWAAEIRDEFTIVNGHPNGGYLLAILGRASVLAAGQEDRHVIGATATYVRPPQVGPVEIRTDVLRRGRTASQVRALLVQDDVVTVDVVMTVGDLDDGPAVWGSVPPVALPDEETCRERRGPSGSILPGLDEPPLSKVLRTAYDPSTLSFLSGTPSGDGELRAWLRLADGREWDPASLLFAVDALPPATFEVVLTGWVPTLSLTAYIRAIPAPGPLRVRFRANVIAGGRVDETCELWDSADRLVAQSTQLAAIRIG